MMFSDKQAIGRNTRAHSQALIREGGEQGLRGIREMLSTRALRPMVFLGDHHRGIPDQKTEW